MPGSVGGAPRVGQVVEEAKALRVVEALRAVGVAAHLERPGVYAFGVAVQLPDGRRAVWGADGELSATVVRDGVLVGFVPALSPGPAGAPLDEPALVAAIARTDYDAPHRGERRAGPPPRPVRRGLVQRALDGLR